ncbi:XRE family transcriptional regulator [Streptomyces sp. XY431]|uniref:XRE family transcriptional regulator n=1 Tax=Streptomyces sp. XY431 TaxID=1415562 RepID=UPI000AAB6E59|nr:XRE family transcriptional regulator [Streptomyces sp. XY431]
MDPKEPPRPERARTPAEFTKELRKLRTRSELTYRQLERVAAAQGTALPASTIASTLGRATLPRAQFVEAFARACGLSDAEVHEWLEERRSIAAHEPRQNDDAADGVNHGNSEASSAATPAKAGLPWWRRAAGLVGAAAIGVAGTLVISDRFYDSPGPATVPAVPVTGLRMLAVGSWAQIRPARTPELCLTEGRDRTGRYRTAVAVQRLCSRTDLPNVFLEPLAKDTVQIQWHHEKYGIGCLTVLTTDPGRDLLEPRDDCADNDRAQQFRIELFGSLAAPHFRIRPVVTGECLSLHDQDTEEGAEVVQGRCSGAGDQDFLVDLTVPPRSAAGRA